VRFDFSLDPFIQFTQELSKAEGSLIKDFNAMFLATADSQNLPTVRTVLFKGIIRDGFSFYTNYNSPKSKALKENPKASALFFWPSLDQQIRIEGVVEMLTRQESEAYFATRPRLSQIGAWASNQSEEIQNLELLERKVRSYEQKYQGSEVPCPPHWGGWHLLPLKIEFWFGREGRLHERYVYERTALASQEWKKYLKAP
jgi:pyridoxamine 5'-phosphate oxidase